MNTILVPLDGSPLADRILPYVQLLAPVFRARVHLIRAISATAHDRLLRRSALVDARGRDRSASMCCLCAGRYVPGPGVCTGRAGRVFARMRGGGRRRYPCVARRPPLSLGRLGNRRIR
jgi:hypothetical protein